jgi:hypothetical protein
MLKIPVSSLDVGSSLQATAAPSVCTGHTETFCPSRLQLRKRLYRNDLENEGDRLCGPAVRVAFLQIQRPGLDFRRYQIF